MVDTSTDIYAIHGRVYEHMGYFIKDEAISFILANLVIGRLRDKLPLKMVELLNLSSNVPGLLPCQQVGAGLLELCGLSPLLSEVPFGPNLDEMLTGDEFLPEDVYEPQAMIVDNLTQRVEPKATSRTTLTLVGRDDAYKYPIGDRVTLVATDSGLVVA